MVFALSSSTLKGAWRDWWPRRLLKLNNSISNCGLILHTTEIVPSFSSMLIVGQVIWIFWQDKVLEKTEILFYNSNYMIFWYGLSKCHTKIIPLHIYPEVGLLEHMVLLFLIFWGTAILLSIAAALLNIPTKSVQGFQSLHILKLKSGSQRDICISMFTAALFTIAKIWKQPKYPSTDEWMIKICIYIEWNII